MARYTICKSTMIIWLLLFSFLFKIERPTVPLFIVISMISGGLILFEAKGDVSFHSGGFVLVRERGEALFLSTNCHN